MKKIYITLLVAFICTNLHAAGDATKPLKVDWSFNGFFGTFDRAQLQRGFQVYKEVCASCHSMKHLSYRNLGEKGGPEFSDAEVKAIAAGYQVKDGPNEDGEMFDRSGLPKDKFKSPYPNEKAARAVNGGAYPPDMSVLVKARAGGPDYIYSILMGYDESPPADLKIEEGVYYNKFMAGKKN
jgi:ubiquinol-cytochrome c reductase cytochrome c1 subunit